MRLQSTTSTAGPAILAVLDHPLSIVECPEGWGLILWGRASRVDALTIALNSPADWIADYSPSDEAAIVVWSDSPSVSVGGKVQFDAVPQEAVCPVCGGGNYVANGLNWLCRDCGRQWRKERKKDKRPIIV